MKKHKKYRTDFLFSDSGFLMGMGSAINLAGNYFDFSSSSSESEADNRALESDWGMVGQDIQSAREKIIKRKSTAIQQEISF